ncbi:MAG: ATP-binding cassette domain-containing protein, partial [Armatimonadota bacterium]|nr:ATP-binding cassette domain-containing protein [Armatimonadota bacterium]
GALAPDPVAPAPAPSVVAPPAMPPAARETGGLDMAATAFVANVLRLFGAASLRKFLAAYDPARRDQAAVSVYQQPLAALQGAWLSGLQRKPGGGAALRTFLKSLGPILRPYRWRQLEIFAYMLFGAAYSQVLPYASKYLIDNISSYFRATIRPEPHAYALQLLIHYAAILFFVYLLNALVTLRQNYATGWINMHLLVALQERLFVHLQRLSHNFYANAKIGDLMTRLSSDMQSVQSAANQVINAGLYQGVILLAAIGSILFQTFKAGVPLMGLLMLCIIPLFALSFVSLRGLMRTASREQQRRVGEAATTVQENLNAQPLIKALGLEEQAIAGYHSRLTALLKAGLRLALLGGVSGMSAQMMATISQLIVLCVGGYYVLTNPDALGHSGMTLGTLLLLTQLLPLMLAPVAGLANVGQSVQSASGALDRILELTEEPVAVADKPDAVPLAPLSQDIRLEHISFGYGGPKPILSDLDLTIPAGANVAFVGPSGCGKSTTINLLMRFYDPEAGRVLFDGQDLRDVTLASLRGQIGLVFQETFIFDTTVAENIRIARMDATDDEVIAAARSAQLDDFVQALPDKYNTILGERGARMSGGQRQRLAIARVILRNPRILILDEATSALDAHTEAEILETLSQLTEGRTTIAITHRLSWAATADRIYVLDEGKLAEEGSHADLVGAGGLYQTLYEEQTGFATSGGTERGGVQATRLGTVPLFAGLGDDELAALASHLRRETVKTGADIVSQGEPGDKLYIINSGGADVLVAEGGGERRVNTLAVGDYFGEMALLSGEPRTATVRATAPTELYSLAQADFRALLETHPALKDAVTQTMKNRRVALTGSAQKQVPLPGD